MTVLSCVVPVHSVIGVAALSALGKEEVPVNPMARIGEQHGFTLSSGCDWLDAKVHHSGNRHTVIFAIDPEVDWYVLNPHEISG